MKLTRRKFLEGAAVGAGGLLLGCGKDKLDAGASWPPRAGDLVPLGKTGIKLTRVGLGTGMRGSRGQSNQTRLGAEKLHALLRGAYERGVRWFDLADMYGSHPFLTPALKGIPRDRYTIVSKIWWRRGGLPERQRPLADVVVPRFLKEIGTDYIDLILLHCVTAPDWPNQLGDQMNALAALKKRGLIRAHGVSCHSLRALSACADEPWVDSVHARINPYGAVMDGPATQVAPVLARIHAAGKGVVGMKLIGEGRFRDSGEMRDTTLRYVMHLGCVDTMVVGFERLAEIDDFTARLRRVPAPAAAAKTT